MIFRVTFITAFALVLLSSGRDALARNYTIETSPVKQGRVLVDGKFVGVAPVTVDLTIREPATALVTAEKDGAVSYWPVKLNRFDKAKRYVVRLEPDESASATVESSTVNSWRTIDVQLALDAEGNVDEELVWQTVVSAVTDRFSEIENANRQAFTLRSAWVTRAFTYAVVRSRILVRRPARQGLELKIQVECEIFRRNAADIAVNPEKFEPYTRAFSKDEEVVTFLIEQLSRTPSTPSNGSASNGTADGR